MPTHRFACPACAKILKVDDALLARIQARGNVTSCPACKTPISLGALTQPPAPEPDYPVAEAEPEPRPRPRRSRRPVEYDDDEDEEDDRPRRRGRSRSSARNETNVVVRVGGGGFPHLLHFIVTCCTCGAWLPVWILLYFFTGRR